MYGLTVELYDTYAVCMALKTMRLPSLGLIMARFPLATVAQTAGPRHSTRQRPASME